MKDKMIYVIKRFDPGDTGLHIAYSTLKEAKQFLKDMLVKDKDLILSEDQWSLYKKQTPKDFFDDDKAMFFDIEEVLLVSSRL